MLSLISSIALCFFSFEGAFLFSGKKMLKHTTRSNYIRNYNNRNSKVNWPRLKENALINYAYAAHTERLNTRIWQWIISMNYLTPLVCWTQNEPDKNNIILPLGYQRMHRDLTLLTSTSTWENRLAKFGIYFCKHEHLEKRARQCWIWGRG